MKTDKFEVLGVNCGKYILQVNMFDKSKKCAWSLLTVYGAAHDEHKPEFLAELSSFCHKTRMPYLVGGDFNILRHNGEKNKQSSMSHFSAVFNSVIHLLGLREIFMSGGCFTWSNKQEHPTLEKLDRVLMSPEWEDIYPLVSVHKLVKELSDHNPLLLDGGNASPRAPGNRSFKFDMAWLSNPEFLPIVADIWSRPVYTDDPIDVLNIKLKRCKKFFKGWGSNIFGHYKIRKKTYQT